MNRILILIALATGLSFPAFSQENKPLPGKIIAPNLEESTVHVINKTQGTGTLNTSSGNFKIQVRENDTLLFSSVQYHILEIPVTAEILTRELLIVNLTEVVNELPEMNISNLSLTGRLDTDLANMKVVEDLPVNLNFRSLSKNSLFESDRKESAESPVNIASKQNEPGYGVEGLNLLGGLGLIADLVGIKSKSKILPPPAVTTSVQIRKLFDDEFFRSSLGIKEEQILDFIFYLDNVGLSRQLFQPEYRLALIEVLIDHGKIYNNGLESRIN